MIASHQNDKKSKKDTGFHFSKKWVVCAHHGNLEKSQAKKAVEGTTLKEWTTIWQNKAWVA